MEAIHEMTPGSPLFAMYGIEGSFIGCSGIAKCHALEDNLGPFPHQRVRQSREWTVWRDAIEAKESCAPSPLHSGPTLRGNRHAHTSTSDIRPE